MNEWRARLDRALEQRARRRSGRAAVRRQLDIRRRYGLDARHAQKLARRARDE